MCRRRCLLVPAAAALLLAPAVLAMPASSGAPPEASLDASLPSGAPSAPKLKILRVQSPVPDLSVYAGSPTPSTRIQNCSGVRCLWDYLSQKAKAAAERLGDDVEELADFIAYSHDDTLPIPKDDDDDDDEWSDEWNDQGADAEDGHESETPEATNPLGDVDDYGHPSYPRQPPLLMTVALLAIAIGYFSLLGIHHLHRRTARLCPQHHTLPTVSREHRRCQHGDSRSARRARRKIQQRTITKCVRGVLRRWTRGDVADASEGRRGKPVAPPEGEASTMGDDLARLREVADFIDDVVAAEQGMAPSGRSGAPNAPTPCTRLNSPTPGQAFADMDHGYPPSYDTVTDDHIPVANGFQYTPGLSTRPPGHGDESDSW